MQKWKFSEFVPPYFSIENILLAGKKNFNLFNTPFPDGVVCHSQAGESWNIFSKDYPLFLIGKVWYLKHTFLKIFFKFQFLNFSSLCIETDN